MTEYVVLLDSGGKQDFIFASNKQIVNVGASHLIAQVGTTWVREAIQAATDGGATVGWRVLSSGKAVLAVPDRETGTTDRPYLDVGVELRPHPSTATLEAGGHVAAVRPGGPCLLCLSGYDPRQVAVELDPEFAKAR